MQQPFKFITVIMGDSTDLGLDVVTRQPNKSLLECPVAIDLNTGKGYVPQDTQTAQHLNPNQVPAIVGALMEVSTQENVQAKVLAQGITRMPVAKGRIIEAGKPVYWDSIKVGITPKRYEDSKDINPYVGIALERMNSLIDKPTCYANVLIK